MLPRPMRIVIFCHSLVSDWNHGNAHFLRGIVRVLSARGHEVRVYEPAHGWSLENLLADRGEGAVADFHAAFPSMGSVTYGPDFDPAEALDGADLVLVHEWSDPALVARIGAHRAMNSGYRLLFHDTHHRAATDPAAMTQFDLRHFDGVLAFGETVRKIYLGRGWHDRVWTWHEAADIELFRAHPEIRPDKDLVWVGNWGDDERTAELDTFLLGPVRELGLRATVHGVRYPADALGRLANAGIRYAGSIANHEVPMAFARARLTVHIPRRPYATALPGIPTIRVFEALAAGIPLVSAPWEDAEHLFTPGEDFLTAADGPAMVRQIRAVRADRDLARHLALRGRQTIEARHSCAHRVDELMAILGSFGEGAVRASQAAA